MPERSIVEKFSHPLLPVFWVRWGFLLLWVCWGTVFAQADQDPLERQFAAFKQQVYAKPAEAFAMGEKLLPRWREAENWYYFAETYNWLAVCLFMQKENEQLISFSRTAKDSIACHSGAYNAYYTNILDLEAKNFMKFGRWQDAQDSYTRLIEIEQSYPSPDQEYIGFIINSLGLLNYRMGDYDLAELYYRKALAQKSPKRSTDSFFYYPTTLLNLATLFVEQDKLAEAEKAFRQVSRFRGKGNLPPHYFQAMASGELARIFLKQQKTELAEEILLEGIKNQPQDQIVRPAWSRETRGLIAFEQGDYETALQYYREAMQMRKANRNPYNNIEDFLRNQLRMAHSLQMLGKVDQQFLVLKQAMAYCSGDTSQLVPLRDMQAEDIVFQYAALPVLEELGNAFLGMDALDSAWQVFQLAMDIIASLQENRIFERSKITLSVQVKPLFEGALQCAYLLWTDRKDPLYLETALQMAEGYRAWSMQTALQEARALQLPAIPDSLRKERARLLDNIAFAQKQARAQKRATKDTNDPAPENWSQKLLDLQARYVSFQQTLATQYPIYAEARKLAPVTSSEVHRVLDDDELLISYFWGEKQLYRFVLGQGEADFDTLGISPQHHLGAFLGFLQQADYSAQALQQFQLEAYQLFRWLIPSSLSETILPSWIIIPDGQLFSLPFEALVTDSLAAKDFRSLPYLLTQSSIRYGHSIQLALQQSDPIRGGFASFSPTFSGLMALPASEQLSDNLLEIMAGEKLSGSHIDADFFAESVAEFGAVNLIAHGTLQAQEVDLIFPHAEEAQKTSRLLMNEIYNLGLASTFVSLAVCEAGQGRSASGEGIMNLSRAFRFAGASSVLFSRWQADLRVAGELFPDFYVSWKKGSTPAKALQAAQRAFLARAPRDQTHPAFWAGYSLVGEAARVAQSRGLYVLLGLMGLVVLSYFLYRAAKKN